MLQSTRHVSSLWFSSPGLKFKTPKKHNPPLKTRRWSCCATSKMWVSVVHGLRWWLTRQVGSEKEHMCPPELPQVTEVNTHTHTHSERWMGTDADPSSSGSLPEKLVPGVEVLWPQRECSNDSACLSDLTPDQSRAVGRQSGWWRKCFQAAKTKPNVDVHFKNRGQHLKKKQEKEKNGSRIS